MEVNGVSFLNIVHADAARALRCVLIHKAWKCLCRLSGKLFPEHSHVW